MFYDNVCLKGPHGRVVNETYDAETETRPRLRSDETETRRSKQRLETFGQDEQAVTGH